MFALKCRKLGALHVFNLVKENADGKQKEVIVVKDAVIVVETSSNIKAQ